MYPPHKHRTDGHIYSRCCCARARFFLRHQTMEAHPQVRRFSDASVVATICVGTASPGLVLLKCMYCMESIGWLMKPSKRRSFVKKATSCVMHIIGVWLECPLSPCMISSRSWKWINGKKIMVYFLLMLSKLEFLNWWKCMYRPDALVGMLMVPGLLYTIMLQILREKKKQNLLFLNKKQQTVIFPRIREEANVSKKPRKKEMQK